MKSLWNEEQARECQKDPLSLRVYTSRLLGQETDLVLHGGGNTSVKTSVVNRFGETEEILYIKGSGWDLASIEAAGFAPVRLKVLKQMAALQSLDDREMVKMQRAAMIDPYAPNPSVEAILHAIIPYTFVDHTHADAVLTITNTTQGEKSIREIYGDRVLVVPYVMPGFVLAKKIFEMTQGLDWKKVQGLILMNHGIFTFADNARSSYEKMIELVCEAEVFLEKKGAQQVTSKIPPKENLLELARLRKIVSKLRQAPVITKLDQDSASLGFSNFTGLTAMTLGPLTPDHVIRTKRVPAVIGKNSEEDLLRFAQDYQKYFQKNTDGKLIPLDSAPRWAIWPEHGVVSFGRDLEETRVISDISGHTLRAIQKAEALGGWKPLSEKELFEVEYWVLEQAKLKKTPNPLDFQGKIALVTGAASGIGRACVEALVKQGAVVAALDKDPKIASLFSSPGILGMVCDVAHREQIQACVEKTVRMFGGLDVLISNAGFFPETCNLSDMTSELWEKSLSVNLTSHAVLIQVALPYLQLGINASIVVIASKNVQAPGPGASAYSVAKAGLTQLARVAALELAPQGIRVNVIHPNQVFDTAIWTEEVLQARAKKYGVSVDEYKSSNLLKVEITSKDVARLVCSVAGSVFSKTTGAQVPIDGGNDRVI